MLACYINYRKSASTTVNGHHSQKVSQALDHRRSLQISYIPAVTVAGHGGLALIDWLIPHFTGTTRFHTLNAIAVIQTGQLDFLGAKNYRGLGFRNFSWRRSRVAWDRLHTDEIMTDHDHQRVTDLITMAQLSFRIQFNSLTCRHSR